MTVRAIILLGMSALAGSATGRNDPNYQRILREATEWGKVMHDGRIPDLLDIRNADRALSRTRCVGKIKRWNRRYAFATAASPPRLDILAIQFVLAMPHSAVRPGVLRVPVKKLATVDDGFFDTANGTYSIRTRKVTFDYCGPNHPGQPTKPES